METEPVESIKILNSDINLDFDKPLDYVEPKKEPEPENEIIEKKHKRYDHMRKQQKVVCLCHFQEKGL